MGSLAGAITRAIGAALTWFVDNASWEHYAIIALVVALGWVWVTDEEPQTRTKVKHVPREMEEGDLPTPTIPELTLTYEAPDSQDTKRTCATIPSWLATNQPSDNSQQSSDQPSRDSLASLSISPTATYSSTTALGLRSLGYVIVPMVDGAPTWKITPNKASLSAYDPRDASGLEFQADIPRPTNRLSAWGGTLMLPETIAINTGLQYAHTWRVGMPLIDSFTAEWNGGYGLTEHGSGPTAGVTLSADVRW